jgi:hypothetical protein
MLKDRKIEDFYSSSRITTEWYETDDELDSSSCSSSLDSEDERYIEAQIDEKKHLHDCHSLNYDDSDNEDNYIKHLHMNKKFEEEAYLVNIDHYLSDFNTKFKDESLIYLVQKIKKYMREVQVHHAARYNPILDFVVKKD